MKRTVSFVEQKLVAASQKNRNSLILVRATCYFDNFSGAASTHLFDKLSLTKLVRLKLINVGDRHSVNCL